jgi:hypothetical protein
LGASLIERSAVNVGTVPAVPPPPVIGPVGGKVRRRLMPLGRGGGPVLVEPSVSPSWYWGGF